MSWEQCSVCSGGACSSTEDPGTDAMNTEKKLNKNFGHCTYESLEIATASFYTILPWKISHGRSDVRANQTVVHKNTSISMPSVLFGHIKTFQKCK